MGIRKAVIPAAGLGTRFLPATKAMPKEMLPVVDKPVIQYVVEEARAAGLDDVLIILGRNKTAVSNHFDRNAELEYVLQHAGDDAKLRQVKESTDLADVHYVRQGDPLGLGHAVGRAHQHVGDEPFVVLLGDEIIDEHAHLLSRMVEESERHGTTVLALMEVEPERIHLYGCAAVEATDDPDVVRVTSLVEKPTAELAPSNLAVIGRYVLQPSVFPVLERTAPGANGEIQLTDALNELANTPLEHGGGVTGVIFRGRRFDTGSKVEYIKAVLELALERPDLGPTLRPWLRELSASLGDE
ncbi:MAG TPA: UTP--glucose-1-phosphate uridylyltransferase [Microbacteriaceae bacterium]|nr:UTP--glucose-1-phosphate uridylyltransferase [Microbacteriaceae bacterium]